MGPTSRIPTLPLGSIWKLLGMESYLYRSQPLFCDKSVEAGLQGRLDFGGSSGAMFEGHEQDHGLDKVG